MFPTIHPMNETGFATQLVRCWIRFWAAVTGWGALCHRACGRWTHWDQGNGAPWFGEFARNVCRAPLWQVDVTIKMISKDHYQVEEVVIQRVLNEIIQGQPKKVESSNILIIRLVYPKRLICLVRSSCQLYLLYKWQYWRYELKNFEAPLHLQVHHGSLIGSQFFANHLPIHWTVISLLFHILVA